MRDPQQMHVALFYDGEEEYTRGVLSFASPALEAHEPVALAVPGPRTPILESPLRRAGADPGIFDMVELHASLDG